MNQRRRLNTRSIHLTVAGMSGSRYIALVGLGWSLANISFEGKLLRHIGISRRGRHIVTTSEGRIREVNERNPRNTIQ